MAQNPLQRGTWGGGLCHICLHICLHIFWQFGETDRNMEGKYGAGQL